MKKYNQNLAKYLTEVSDHELLGPEGEVALAMHIEEAEIEVWRRILSFEPAFPVIEEALAKEGIDLSAFTRPRAGKAARSKYVGALAAHIRAHDRDRVHLDEVLKAIDAGVSRAQGRTRWRRGIDVATQVAAAARQRFVAANLRLVISLGRNFSGYGIPLEDLIQEGNIGLMKGVDRFDYRQGFRFSTYAGWWIRHAMRRAVANTSRTVRLPVHVQDEHQRISRADREISAKLGRKATNQEIAESCETTSERVIAIRRRARAGEVSLDEPLGEDGSTRLDLLIAPENDERTPFEGLLQQQESAQVQALLATLTRMQADVLQKRFGLAGHPPMTLQMIGDEYDLSRERIRQIQSEALRRLRATLQAQEEGSHRNAASS